MTAAPPLLIAVLSHLACGADRPLAPLWRSLAGYWESALPCFLYPVIVIVWLPYSYLVAGWRLFGPHPLRVSLVMVATILCVLWAVLRLLWTQVMWLNGV